mgnify:CR=1 FL=1
MENLLDIQDLHAVAGEKEILKGLNLKINKGETHVIMGPNGAGKSTTANVILNNPEYKKVSGKVVFEGEDISDLSTDKIAKKGVFMSFQSPVEIPGISTTNFLKYAKNKITDKTKMIIINNPNNRSVSDIYSGVGPDVTYNEIHLYLKMFCE